VKEAVVMFDRSAGNRIWTAALVASAVHLAGCARGLDPDRTGLDGTGGATASSGGGGAGGTTTVPTGGGGQAGGTTSTDTMTTTSTTTTDTMTTTSTTTTTTTTDTGPPPTGLYVQYKTTISAASTNQLKAVFNVVNGGADPATLSALTIRYYYTIDGDMAEEFHCDYAMLGCGVVNGTFGTVAGVNTDHYLEVSLSAAGTLAAGAQTGEIQARWNKTGFTNFDQSNDYSFDGSLVDFTTWDKVTLYSNGTLLWGVEP
jgi:hypothetical protein